MRCLHLRTPPNSPVDAALIMSGWPPTPTCPGPGPGLSRLEGLCSHSLVRTVAALDTPPPTFLPLVTEIHTLHLFPAVCVDSAHLRPLDPSPINENKQCSLGELL